MPQPEPDAPEADRRAAQKKVLDQALAEHPDDPFLLDRQRDWFDDNTAAGREAAVTCQRWPKSIGNAASGRRYSPAVCIGCEKKGVTGSPDPEHVSTSYIERSNLSMRMSTRRFTRLTNALFKKLENRAASVAIYLTWYNFGRVHQTLKTTPAVKGRRCESRLDR